MKNESVAASLPPLISSIKEIRSNVNEAYNRLDIYAAVGEAKDILRETQRLMWTLDDDMKEFQNKLAENL